MSISECPTCGSYKIKRKKTNVTFEVRGQRKVVKNLMLEVCPDCGEKLFDLKAGRKVDAALGIRYPHRKRKVA